MVELNRFAIDITNCHDASTVLLNVYGRFTYKQANLWQKVEKLWNKNETYTSKNICLFFFSLHLNS